MAEIQQVSSSSLPPARRQGNPRPPLPHPKQSHAPLRLPADETQDLRPPLREAAPLGGAPGERGQAAAERLGEQERPSPALRLPPRAPTERLLRTALLLGLALTAAVLLLNPGLTRADRLLGITVLLAGAVLLVLLEICRWTQTGGR